MSEQERMELARAIEETKDEAFVTINRSQFIAAMTKAAMDETSENNRLIEEKSGEACSPMLGLVTMITNMSIASKAWNILTGQGGIR